MLTLWSERRAALKLGWEMLKLPLLLLMMMTMTMKSPQKQEEEQSGGCGAAGGAAEAVMGCDAGVPHCAGCPGIVWLQASSQRVMAGGR